MKRRGRCPKCDGTRIGKLSGVRDVGHYDKPGNRMLGVVVKPTWTGDEFVPQGQIEAYVCTECGYFEEYVASPAEVPWDTMRDFEWVKATGQPFR